jgi:hypothetical protein
LPVDWLELGNGTLTEGKRKKHKDRQFVANFVFYALAEGDS